MSTPNFVTSVPDARSRSVDGLQVGLFTTGFTTSAPDLAAARGILQAQAPSLPSYVP